MKKLILASTTLIIIGLSGCSTAPKLNNVAAPEKITKPDIGMKSSSFLGDALIVSVSGVRTDVIRLGTADGVNSVIRGGTFCLMPDGTFYSEDNNAVGIKNSFGQVIKNQSWVRYDISSNEVCAISGFSCYNSNEISIKYEKNVLCAYSDSSMKQTIEYNGKSDDTLKFTYREFSGDMARPAFTTDFTVDLKEGSVLIYKGARVNIIKATNSQIDYITEKGFN